LIRKPAVGLLRKEVPIHVRSPCHVSVPVPCYSHPGLDSGVQEESSIARLCEYSDIVACMVYNLQDCFINGFQSVAYSFRYAVSGRG
jgi:hypothetical protein